jgi:hypothetical protein
VEVKDRFDVDQYRGELEAAPTNYEIATNLLFENERVRIWEMLLEPGQRIPFHHHRTAYFWVCQEGGRGIQRFPDGTMLHVEFEPNDFDFLDEERLETDAIHDFENSGDRRCRFMTVELLQ